ncbi:MAG: hypothetical protein VXX86_05840, partial [Planctomycetota bacterium]|nr:hypothetical protein [Planctomycetota bacterium]
MSSVRPRNRVRNPEAVRILELTCDEFIEEAAGSGISRPKATEYMEGEEGGGDGQEGVLSGAKLRKELLVQAKIKLTPGLENMGLEWSAVATLLEGDEVSIDELKQAVADPDSFFHKFDEASGGA